MTQAKENGIVNITAHRGHGVTEKDRSRFLRGARFYPENSLAAFRSATGTLETSSLTTHKYAGAGAGAGAGGGAGVGAGAGAGEGSSASSDYSIGDEDNNSHNADAIEFDIHVTKDGQAVVIHGTDVLNPYADYIGTQERDIASHNLFLKPKKPFKVYELTTAELQNNFTLVAHDIETSLGNFDSLTPEQKEALPDEEKQIILETKKALHISDPETHKIPTLTELLNLMLEINQQRAREGKTLTKMNIELKGEKSAIASLESIMKFYQDNPDAKEFVRPEDMVFLGRGEIGEIVIANALLKGTFDIDKIVNEIQEYCVAEYITTHTQDHTKNAKLLQDYHRETQGIERSYKKYSHKPMFSVVLAEMQKKDYETPKVDNSHINGLKTFEKYVEYRGYQEFKKSNRTDAILDQLNKTAKKLGITVEPTAISSAGASAGAASGNIDSHADIMLFVENISNKLGAAKTNFMISTGQLFGDHKILPNGNFDLEPDVFDITESGRKKIMDVFKRNYNGIDIGLFDYCSDVIDTIDSAVDKLHLDPKNLMLGASATNWKASKAEYSPVKPHTATLIAHNIAKDLGIDLLLKVDEPRIFRSILNSIEAYEAEYDIEYGSPLPIATGLDTSFGEHLGDASFQSVGGDHSLDDISVISEDNDHPFRLDDTKFTSAAESKCQEPEVVYHDSLDEAQQKVLIPTLTVETGHAKGEDFPDNEEEIPDATYTREMPTLMTTRFTMPKQNLAHDFSVSNVDISLNSEAVNPTVLSPRTSRPPRKSNTIAKQAMLDESGEIYGFVYSILLGETLHNLHVSTSHRHDSTDEKYHDSFALKKLGLVYQLARKTGGLPETVLAEMPDEGKFRYSVLASRSTSRGAACASVT